MANISWLVVFFFLKAGFMDIMPLMHANKTLNIVIM